MDCWACCSLLVVITRWICISFSVLALFVETLVGCKEDWLLLVGDKIDCEDGVIDEEMFGVIFKLDLSVLGDCGRCSLLLNYLFFFNFKIKL